MAGKKKFTKTEFRMAVEKSRGIKAEIARLLNCSYNTVTNYLNRESNDDVLALFKSQREVIKDTLETKFMQLVDEGNEKAILFGLETIAKDRGWTKRTEITGADGEAIRFSADVMAILKAQGLSPADVQAEFEKSVRALANVNG
ncbi:MAG: hypothetical protein SFZ02_19230 [bacterium]|nr:hypothetical protein [bacterium]